MSVEALACALVVEDGVSALRRLYGHGVSASDFPLYEDEFRWIERRLAKRKPVNRRVFREKFPDFDWAVPSEGIDDLAVELKEQRAFEAITNIVASGAEQLEKDNALDVATEIRELLTKVTRKHAPIADVDLDDYETVIEEMRQGFILAKQGVQPGVPTGFIHLDHHLGGWMPGQFIEILGRTGEGKSYKMAMSAWAAKKAGFKVGLFSPEQSAHETRCRYHTIASADPKVKADLELKASFRNRALMFRRGFNLKSYERFCQYMREIPGSLRLLSGAGMADRMSVGYIEDRLVEYELDLVLVDPIYLLKPVRTTSEGGWQETVWIAESLHELSERYQVPVVFSNQAHMDNNKGDAPGKHDSFGGKGMVHLSDAVIGVKNISEERRMICRSSKSRFGASGFRYEMEFHPNTGVIKETTPLLGNYFNGPDGDEENEEVVKRVVRQKGKVTT
jgi:hypothetical protein